uniref:Amino acid transporter transmembrane domain-containing protein n=1 Tax=Chromera velia CCMP2878 TaxID=1169474 RepID=A0A0G4I2R8_9ALVE|eukprot:Cvel_10466.t1-p1 / transcript=Cvel_10466.t1 / gene=Cvel_10466 / organism=Chromera_velia_CCMP2878 / gene_product=Sodium-coupled neutral amino acid transporter 5, putative / transcript_product=Sodium-coupled neutral amino acid transporter 5, putative / location=Cvel_scaffold631:2483-7941(-) / protein_length=653 / sequence_SO=supercontig / SO=protein_coding / is_pseudo=false
MTNQRSAGTELLTGEVLSPPPDCSSRKVTPAQLVFCLIATIVGSGVLALPLTAAKCGIAFGLIAILCAGLLNVVSLDLIIACARRTGSNNYEEIAECAFGSGARLITVFINVTMLFLLIVAYVLTVCDIAAPLLLAWLPADAISTMGGPFGVERGFKVLTLLLVSPLTYLRNLSALRHLSYVVFTMALFITAAVIATTAPVIGKAHTTFVTTPEGQVKPVQIGPDFSGIRLWPSSETGLGDVAFVLPALILSMMSHLNALPLHQELAQPTRKRIRVIILSTVCLCVVLYSIVGVFGYFWASSAICGSLVLNFPPENRLMMVGRLGLGFAVMLKIPLLLLPLRISCWKLVELVQSARKGRWVGWSGIPLENLRPSPVLSRSPPEELSAETEGASRDTTAEPPESRVMGGPLSISRETSEGPQQQQQDKPGFREGSRAPSSAVRADAEDCERGEREGVRASEDSLVAIELGGDNLKGNMRELLVPGEGDDARNERAARLRARENAGVSMSLQQPGGGTEADQILSRSFLSVDRQSLLYEVATGWDVPTPGFQVNEMPQSVLIILTTVLLVGLAVTVLSVSSIVSVWALAGSSCGISIAFIMPPLFFLRIRRQQPWNLRKVGALLMLICALPTGILAAHQAFLHIQDPTCPAEFAG